MAQQPADELGVVSKSIHAEFIRPRRCKGNKTQGGEDAREEE